MRILPALALAAASTVACTVAQGAEPTPKPPEPALAHVAISDVGEYAATVSRNGAPTNLWVRIGAESVELRLRMDDPSRLRYEIKRTGARQFSLEGEIVPSWNKPYVVGHFPFGERTVDVRLWLTDR
jgi:hypothetical protein